MAWLEGKLATARLKDKTARSSRLTVGSGSDDSCTAEGEGWLGQLGDTARTAGGMARIHACG